MAKILKGDFTRPVKNSKKENQPKELPIPAYQLQISLPFSDPLIWRRIRVPGQMTLAGLHRVIQVCMSWKDTATHQFLVGKIFYQPGFGIESSVRKPEFDEANFKLYQLEEGMEFIFTYLYDGGEGWELEITLEEIIEGGMEEKHAVLLAGEQACPPEDVGDIHRYQQMLADLLEDGDGSSAIKLEISGETEFDPEICDHQKINSRLKEIG